MTEDRRCTYKWLNKYGEQLRCMLDKGHPKTEGHIHGIQSSKGYYVRPREVVVHG